MTRTATVAFVRPVEPTDGEFFTSRGTAWIAQDTEGRQFGGATEEEARQMCHDYNHPPRRSSRRPQEGAA